MKSFRVEARSGGLSKTLFVVPEPKTPDDFRVIRELLAELGSMVDRREAEVNSAPSRPKKGT